MDFIQLNGYDVKDQVARTSVEQLRSQINNVATKDDIAIINNKIENLNIEQITNLEITINKVVNEDLTNINQQINNIINNLNEYATKQDVNNMYLELNTQINNKLASVHSHTNLNVLEQLTMDKIESWNNRSDFSGSYNDLTDKPILFSGNYNDLTNKPLLFSGDYNDLTNKPALGESSETISQEIEDNTNMVLNEIARFITVTFENIKNPDGEEVPLPTNVATIEYVDQQLALYFARIQEQIGNLNQTEVPTKLSQLEIDCCAGEAEIKTLKNLFIVEINDNI